MKSDNPVEDRDDLPAYRDPQEIDGLELSKALRTLHLLGGDPYLRMQAFNLS